MIDVTLFAFPGTDGLDSVSPYCLKVISALKYLQIPHEISLVGTGMPKEARRGRLPVARIGAYLMEDSTNILKALDRMSAHPGRRLYPDDADEWADVILLEDWADESLVQNLSYYRGLVEANAAEFETKVLRGLKPLLRWYVASAMKGSTRKKMKASGYSDIPDDERRARFGEHVGALERRVTRADFLCGVEPTAADFAVYATLKIIVVSRLPELCPAILKSKKLSAWMERMDALVSVSPSVARPQSVVRPPAPSRAP